MKFSEKIVYHLLCTGGRAVGALPLRMQYGLADFISFVLYRIVRYRVDVARINLKNSFPDKTDAERLEIEKKFYKHLGDVFLESFTMISLSEKAIRERFFYHDTSPVTRASADRPMIAAMAHFALWEYSINYSLYTPHPVLAVYAPLISKPFDAYYFKARSRFGVIPVAMQSAGREILKRRKENCIVALIADQYPAGQEDNQWFDFLGQKTRFFKGIEYFATKFGMSVEYMSINKARRGYYEIDFRTVYDGVEELPEGEITKRYIANLEQDIYQNPHLWMWTHKRWKKYPDGTCPYPAKK